MEKKISYLNRDFNDCRQALIDFSKKYYPDLAINYDDASVASWMVDINAAAVDDLMYHLDRVYQETNIDSANEKSSLYALARNNGLKIPGPKGAMAEVKFTCLLPIRGENNREPDWSYAPIIRRGTKVTAGSQVFELLEDVDFAQQFNSDGISDRTFVPISNSNGIITQYKISKTAVVIAGESKVYKKVIYAKDVEPFLEITLPDSSVMNVESIVVKAGTSYQVVPTYGEFYSANEIIKCNGSDSGSADMVRFFEVESLAQQYRWDDVLEEGKAKTDTYVYNNNGETFPVCTVTRGEWKRTDRKFITEYTDNGYLKITFGAGISPETSCSDYRNATDFSKFRINRIINNSSLGYLPDANSTVFILYRVGGGKSSNVAEGAINYISKLNAELRGDDSATRNAVKGSIAVVSTSPSVSGKDMPSEKEIKYLIKYNSGAQNRCVCLKDYVSRVLQMPPKYGTPFRVGAAEENNKIMIYLLGLDYLGHLDGTLPLTLIENVTDYLSKYRMINDYIEVKSGKIINLSFDIDLFIDKNYNKSDVVLQVIETVKDYMDINKHLMGDDIFVGDIEKEISKVDGVLSIINLDVWNMHNGKEYSGTRISQEVEETVNDSEKSKLDLEASDGVIYSEGDTMLEIKYPEEDITVRCKTR